MIRKALSNYLSLIKFSHTVFALPFALCGFVLGLSQHGLPANWSILLFLVLLCMVFARSAAMAFNRYADYRIDALNARTAMREIPSGIINPNTALFYVILNAALFCLCAFFINKLCFYLSPVALIVILGYSYTKRFTAWCHIVLGLGLALAPIGAYLAVTGEFALYPTLLSLAVLTWTAGFDIIYALQDETFDRNQNLRSIPVAMGAKNALRLSSFLHAITAASIIFLGIETHVGLLYWIGASIFMLMLIYQHLIVSPNDLSRVNLAFGTTNGFASIVFGLFFIAETLIPFR
jgi:4-hydroxybenzoate polyprenyltransferase